MKVAEKEITAPIAKMIPVELEKHGDVRIDKYFWLRERENPEVIDYLTRENYYNEQMTAHTVPLQEKLFEEMKGRIKEDDSSVPYKLNGYWYITRYEKGKDYPIYSRKKETLDAPEEILFDANEMAKGYDYYRLGGLNVSPDNKLIAFAVDTVSRRKYTIQIKNLETGEILPLKIKTTTGGSTWANDNKTLFYARKDSETLRSDKIYKHRLGTDPKKDELVFFEEDETFHTYVYKSKSDQYLIIGSDSTLTSEYRFLDANNPDGEFQVVQPRIRGVEYSIYHYEDHFYLLTNKDGAHNFKVMKTPVSATGEENWVDIVTHSEDVLLEDIDIFKEYLVVSERSDGLNKIRVSRWDGTDAYFLPFDNETYTAYT
ncbi:MAG TPA: S9 family peptidase, partial [Salinimicrobium catena]|nr:S9 family peptidase [Salinimicrobium catena]